MLHPYKMPTNRGSCLNVFSFISDNPVFVLRLATYQMQFLNVHFVTVLPGCKLFFFCSELLVCKVISVEEELDVDLIRSSFQTACLTVGR